jgi:hypothetical protein
LKSVVGKLVLISMFFLIFEPRPNVKALGSQNNTFATVGDWVEYKIIDIPPESSIEGYNGSFPVSIGDHIRFELTDAQNMQFDIFLNQQEIATNVTVGWENPILRLWDGSYVTVTPFQSNDLNYWNQQKKLAEQSPQSNSQFKIDINGGLITTIYSSETSHSDEYIDLRTGTLLEARLVTKENFQVYLILESSSFPISSILPSTKNNIFFWGILFSTLFIPLILIVVWIKRQLSRICHIDHPILHQQKPDAKSVYFRNSCVV